MLFRNSGLIEKSTRDPDHPTQHDTERRWKHAEGAMYPFRQQLSEGSRVLFEDLLTLTQPRR
jgi:hypothetical protein